MHHPFDFSPASRKHLTHWLSEKLEAFYANTQELKLSSDWNIDEIRAFAQQMQLQHGNQAETVLKHVLEGLTQYAVHTPHPNYFGLFNPRPNFPSILADWITATFNPQLAAWSHAPFANEIERRLIEAFGQKFGYTSELIDGTFCTGGAESNLTAVICALNRHFPQFNQLGAKAISGQALIYCSAESHHSIAKAAKMTGLGTAAVRSIPVDEDLQMDISMLHQQIQEDRKAGHIPFLIVGTAGTTGAGAIDDLRAIHRIAKKENLWFHVDAAYGGAVSISAKYREILDGVSTSDSITLDIHKWFSVPMGASLFLCQNKDILHQSFGIQTRYMPQDGDKSQVIDPYIHSTQWSRRFIGLKIYLPLTILGWDAYAQLIEQQMDLADYFRELLLEKGWEIKNTSPLPIICFSHPSWEEQSEQVNLITEKIISSGKVWFSIYPINGKKTMRICITNYATQKEELDELVQLLESSMVVSNPV